MRGAVPPCPPIFGEQENRPVLEERVRLMNVFGFSVIGVFLSGCVLLLDVSPCYRTCHRPALSDCFVDVLVDGRVCLWMRVFFFFDVCFG